MKRTSTLTHPLPLHSLAWQVFRDSTIATLGFIAIVFLLFL